MLRRALRVAVLIGFAAVLGTAAVSQFWFIEFSRPRWGVETMRGGAEFYFYVEPELENDHLNELQRIPRDWSPATLLARPSFRKPIRIVQGMLDEKGLVAFLPWWLLLPAYGLIAVLVLRLTRRRKVGKAFPVEVSSGSGNS